MTRGLLDTLGDAELEAVIAHEIAHIKNRDVRMMLAATISVGILHRMCRNMLRPIPLILVFLIGATVILTLNILFMVIAGVLIASSALMMRFGISRAREFIADATAVELTKRPGALISALRKIARNDGMAVTSVTTRAMMISNSPRGWFATHPPVEERVAALQKFTGSLIAGEDPTAVAEPPPALLGARVAMDRDAQGRPASGRRQFGLRQSPRP